MAFAASSQHRAWTFSLQALEAIRLRVYLEANRRRLAAIADGSRASDAAQTSYSAGSAGGAGPPAKRPRIGADDTRLEVESCSDDSSEKTDGPNLSLADQLVLLRLCCRDVIRICKEAHFDRAIMATAVAFVQRFYLSCALSENSPANFVHTAVFLAIKAEACPYTEVEPFSRRLAAACE